MKPHLWRKALNGVIYVSEPITKDNVEYLPKNIMKVLNEAGTAPFIAVVAAERIELYRSR